MLVAPLFKFNLLAIKALNKLYHSDHLNIDVIDLPILRLGSRPSGCNFLG